MANANVALVKYWGKCDEKLNLPATPSLSFTLDNLGTHTQVLFTESANQDALWINDQPQTNETLERVSRHIDLMTQRGKTGPRAYIYSWNTLPTASGLASSSSSFAALTMATAWAWYGKKSLPPFSLLAQWTREGSGSATRSLLGGLVYLPVGQPGLASSSMPTQLIGPTDWPDLRMVLGVVTEDPKRIGSRAAMQHTQQTSPYHPIFVQESYQDIQEALQAVQEKNLLHLGEITERSALRMHANLWAARPGIIYFQGATMEALHKVQVLRQEGHDVWFTCDAGPHPKALTSASSTEATCKAFESISGIRRILVSSLGTEVRMVSWRDL